MSFGKSQLLKYGWHEGKGLGRDESGMRDPLKVKLKFDNAGVGHDASEEFTFHWWDQIYNKNAQNLKVQRSENGVQLKKSDTITMSTKKNASLFQRKLIYGHFVKGGCLNPTEDTPLQGDDSTSEDEAPPSHDSPVSLFGSLSDEQLLKMCNGQTAHKGARHGINMKGKLARIRSQELTLNNLKNDCDEILKEPRRKKAEKFSINYLNKNHKENLDLEETVKKKKKKSKHKEIDAAEMEEDATESDMLPLKKKKKRSHKKEIEELQFTGENASNGVMDQSVFVPNGGVAYPKSKKKKPPQEPAPPHNGQASSDIHKPKKKKRETQLEPSELTAGDEQNYEYFVAKKKKKRKH